MLGGLYPLIVFVIKDIQFTPGENPLTKKRGPIDALLTDIGLPIPIYLDTQFTGICVEDETKAIDIDTEAQVTKTGDIIYDQRAVNSLTSVSLVAKKDSVALATMFAFSEIILSKLVEKTYSVSYFNGPIMLRNGLLRSLNTSVMPDDNLIRVNLQLSKGDDLSKQSLNQLNVLQNSRGALP